MPTLVEMAEEKGSARAGVCMVLAGVILLLLLVSFGPGGRDLLRGMWTGVALATLVVMVPVARWLRPNSGLARLLDDETVREHRRSAMTAGFWATMASALGLAIATAEGAPVSPFDVARVIATAALVATLVCFATLEFRAARG